MKTIQNPFVKSVLVLLSGGIITKILGFVIKIVYTRMISSYGLSLFYLVMPTYSLLITIASLGTTLAISKLVSMGKRNSKKIVFSIIPVMMIINLVLIFSVVVLSPYIAKNLLHEPNTKNLLIALSLVLPFISLSGIIRGYFFGMQRMFPHTISNIIEQIIKLLLIIIIVPKFLVYGDIVAVIVLILLNIISEICSIIIFLLFLPKNISIKIVDLKPDKNILKDVFKISIPSVSSRLIGNIGYFFEPIILTSILLLIGYQNDFIIIEYGIYNAYALPLLLIPSFFITAISNSLVPEISKLYEKGNMSLVKRRLKQALSYSFLLGIIINIIIFIFAPFLLNTLYHTTKGVSYIRFLSPFFVLFYIESPLISTMQAINKAHVSMKITLLGTILKLFVLATTSLFKIGIYGLLISEIVNIIFIVYLNSKKIRSYLF